MGSNSLESCNERFRKACKETECSGESWVTCYGNLSPSEMKRHKLFDNECFEKLKAQKKERNARGTLEIYCETEDTDTWQIHGTPENAKKAREEYAANFRETGILGPGIPSHPPGLDRAQGAYFLSRPDAEKELKKQQNLKLRNAAREAGLPPPTSATILGFKQARRELDPYGRMVENLGPALYNKLGFPKIDYTPRQIERAGKRRTSGGPEEPDMRGQGKQYFEDLKRKQKLEQEANLTPAQQQAQQKAELREVEEEGEEQRFAALRRRAGSAQLKVDAQSLAYLGAAAGLATLGGLLVANRVERKRRKKMRAS